MNTTNKVAQITHKTYAMQVTHLHAKALMLISVIALTQPTAKKL